MLSLSLCFTKKTPSLSPMSSVVSLVVRRAAARDTTTNSVSEASLTLRPSCSLEALKAAVRQAFAPELDGQVRAKKKRRKARVTCFLPFLLSLSRALFAHLSLRQSKNDDGS